MKLTDIYPKIDESYQNNRQRLIEFFQNHNFDEQQAEQLTDSMKRTVFFLETKKLDRLDIEIDLRKGMKKFYQNKAKKLEKLLKHYIDELYELVPEKQWERLIVEAIILNKLMSNGLYTSRAGENKSLELALRKLFWDLSEYGIGQAKQVNIVYNLFVEFKVDDYGKEKFKNNMLIGEKEQKERIRIKFQQKAMKEKKYAKYPW